MDRQQAEIQLSQLFGLDHFYDHQWRVIKRLLEGERVLLIERTGFGKSLCFQFPATQLPGLTVVFSPLIALMQEQVDKLSTLGIKAACLHSEQVPYLNELTLREAKANQLKLLYVAPERLQNAQWFKSLLRMQISMVVIDEAHCISMWGHDFRPAFRSIIDLIRQLPAACPVLATTATATPQVETDIVQQTAGGAMVTVRGTMFRPNIYLQVQHVCSEEEKLVWLAQYLETVSGTGLVYTGTRGDAERISAWLQFNKVHCIAYHAGMDGASRRDIEHGLMANHYKCVVATNALGMGIDKPDIRFIIHTQIPVTPIHYYQEAGRAGRDGQPADAILLFNKEEDEELPRSFIRSSKPSLSKYKAFLSLLQQQPLGMLAIQRQLNLKQLQFRVVATDLKEQGLIREVVRQDIKQYEVVHKAPPLNESLIRMVREVKEADFERMLAYTQLADHRMEFLCAYLGEELHHQGLFTQEKLQPAIANNFVLDDVWKEKLQDFSEQRFPKIDRWPNMPQMQGGIAASWYGLSNIRHSLQWLMDDHTMELPDYLFLAMLRAFNKAYRDRRFDLVTFVPSVAPNAYLKRVAERLGKLKDIPYGETLKKVRRNHHQRDLNALTLRHDNIVGAFKLIAADKKLEDAVVLLIDDLYDSGETMKEASRTLLAAGVKEICILVIAKTNGLNG